MVSLDRSPNDIWEDVPEKGGTPAHSLLVPVKDVLAKGYRTGDLMGSSPPGAELIQVGCTQMGELLLQSIAEEEIKLSFMPK